MMSRQDIYDALRESFLNRVIVRPLRNSIQDARVLRKWESQGKPIPPPHLVKQRVVKSFAKRFSLRVFVETGTFHGAMIEGTRTTFSKIYSVELDYALFQEAVERFSVFKHIEIRHGDSAEILESILEHINEPCLFWLDAHYSGGGTARSSVDTPIVRELELILTHHVMNHVVLIDDARCFTGQNGYPEMEELKRLVRGFHPDWQISIEDDIIRLHRSPRDIR